MSGSQIGSNGVTMRAAGAGAGTGAVRGTPRGVFRASAKLSAIESAAAVGCKRYPSP
jgi:hypothetical protein